MKSTIHLLALFFLVIVSKVAVSGEQSAHVHGQAKLTLAIENNVLEMQFDSPAANLIGFEHSAKSPEEKQLIKQTEEQLKSPERLFSFVGTACESVETEVDISSLKEDEHGHHEHEHEHEKGHHDDGHSEISVHYHFNCEDAQKLNSVVTTLFEQYPSIEKIRVEWITQTQQGSEILNPDQATLSLE